MKLLRDSTLTDTDRSSGLLPGAAPYSSPDGPYLSPAGAPYAAAPGAYTSLFPQVTAGNKNPIFGSRPPSLGGGAYGVSPTKAHY